MPSSPRGLLKLATVAAFRNSVRPSLLCSLLLHFFELLFCLGISGLMPTAHTSRPTSARFHMLWPTNEGLFELLVFLGGSFVLLVVLLVVSRPSTSAIPALFF